MTVTVAALMGFALALMVAAGSPGPSIAALVARVLTSSLRDVLPFLAAMWIGEAIWLTVTVAGLAVVAQAFAVLFVVIKFMGVGYLLWLAWKMWTAPTDIASRELPAGQRPWRMFLAGMAITLGNPKIMVFYLAVVPTILDLGHLDLAAWVELTLTMLIVLIGIDLGWAVTAARARRLLKNRRAVRVANRTSAVVMVGAAAAIAAE
ncbi:MAG TPA: LysE family translocator [Stellaceae bacterium]|nr:LysE family translocator [Stellaceae bacterium]